jgi:hypothetical protein
MIVAGARLLLGGLIFWPPSVFTAQQVPVPVHADPLTLFAELVPVLKHDRCANCHGATDPFRGFYHPGAVSPNTLCESCHRAARIWRLAPTPSAFHGKSTRELCELWAIFGPMGTTDIHIQTDELINLAFIGRRGGAVTAQYTQPPPLTKAEFLRAFRTWVRDGGAACSGWEGTITEEQSIASNLTLQAMGADVTHWQEGKRTVTVTMKDGQATVTTIVSGLDNNRQVMTDASCQMTIHSQRVYRLVDPTNPPPQPPPAPSSTPGNPAGRPPAIPVTGPGTVRIGLDALGNFRIVVTPPAERIETTEWGQGTNTCGAPNPSPTQDSNTITWDPFVIEITGILLDPRNRRELKGSQDFTIVSAQSDRTMAIEAYGAPSEVDGRSIPFNVKQSWDLRRRP